MCNPKIEDSLAVQSVAGYSQTSQSTAIQCLFLNFSSHLAGAVSPPLPQILSQFYLHLQMTPT